ncbi:MAG: LPS assembly lipoprotein LptE [Candidatus Marinimicrobia bacterium]|nr:LPS assembly lipoprotein LptE [Candidatus Neomarinimicrobiota bacterium]
MLKRVSWFLSVLFLLANCGIYSFKGSIPDHLHDLELVTFKNLTTEFAVETDIEEALTERLLNEQLLPFSAKESPDSRIEGKINSIADKPNSFDENENILDYRLEFRGEVIWYDLVRDSQLFKKNYTVFGTYFSEDENANRSDAEKLEREDAYDEAIEKLIDLIVESMTEEW